jgi:hypothetical protein
MNKLTAAIMIITIYACSHYACSDNSIINKKTTDARNTNNYEEIGHPVKLHYIQRSGMKYLIASGLYGDAGVSIANITLDSIQVEFYKQAIK